MAGEPDADRAAARAGHVPVFLDRTIDLFRPVVDAARAEGRRPVIVDGTLGLGGHSSHLLAEFDHLRIVGVDRDPEALEMATRRLTAYRDRFTPVHARFDDFDRIVENLPADASTAPAAAPSPSERRGPRSPASTFLIGSGKPPPPTPGTRSARRSTASCSTSGCPRCNSTWPIGGSRTRSIRPST